VMFWTSAPCETLVTPQTDDIQGITPLYGPSAQFACSHRADEDGNLAIGVVPFELKCVVASRDYLPDVETAEWTFGDGGLADGIQAEHEYTEPGNYTVSVTVHGTSEGCGEDGWDSIYRKVGYVRACGVPDVEFELDHYDGLQYQILNKSDVSVYGCVQDIAWEVYKGEKATGEPIAELFAKAWEPIIEFPEDGTYTIVGNVGGPAGTGAAMLTVDVYSHRGEGRACDSVGAAGLGGVGGLLILGLAAIRRRD